MKLDRDDELDAFAGELNDVVNKFRTAEWDLSYSAIAGALFIKAVMLAAEAMSVEKQAEPEEDDYGEE